MSLQPQPLPLVAVPSSSQPLVGVPTSSQPLVAVLSSSQLIGGGSSPPDVGENDPAENVLLAAPFVAWPHQTYQGEYEDDQRVGYNDEAMDYLERSMDQKQVF